MCVRTISIFSFVFVRKIKKNIMSRRSQRTDDGTPLGIIQEELFELQRQRRQLELQTPKGPPPDMPYYATVAPPSKTHTPPSKFANEPKYDVEQPPPSPPVKSALKKENAPPKKKQTGAVPVDLQDPTEIQVPLIQERTSGETVRRVKIGLLLTLILFVCMYAYPVFTNIPPEKRASALTTLSVAFGLGAVGASLWPMMEKSEP